VAGECVLVVDDSAEIREALRELVLKPLGCSMLSASNGQDGLRLAIEEQPDLIILDERMPGLSGIELLAALQQRNIEIPAILTTFHGSEELAVQALRHGAWDYIAKPFEPADMQQAIQRILVQVRLRRERDRLTQQLQQVNERLERQIQEMQTLYAIGRSVTSLLDLNTVLTRVVEAAVFAARGEEGLLLLTEPGRQNLVLRAAKNLDEKVASHLHVPVEDSLAGEVLRTGKPLTVGGKASKIVTGYLVNALIYVPVRSPERGIIGVLGVTNRRADRPFGEHEVQILSALADYAGVALENARLYESAETERRKLEAVLRDAGEGIIVLDAEKRLLLCNPAACEALSLSEEAVGQPTDALFDHPALRELLRMPPQPGQTARAEVAVPGGRIFNAQLGVVEGVGYVMMLQDITHFKELDRIKSEFVSTVSHDLRTPLTTIQGYVSLLDRVGPLNEQQQEFVQRIRTSVADITELIGELLDLGRIEAGHDMEMEPVQMEEIVSSVVEECRPLAMAKRQELRWEPQPLPAVQGNPRRLRQVVENLLSNAIKYTQEGGWVAVEASAAEHYLLVRVSDNGIGIPLADQPYIFERFYRVESEETQGIKGTGLGLTIVRSVVEKHGGRVWVESRPGEGSVFSVVLPIIE